jgi:hypothetical protein
VSGIHDECNCKKGAETVSNGLQFHRLLLGEYF